MNNIEILEHKLKLNEKTKFDWFGEKEFKAIENLIQENKELKEEIKSLNKIIKYANYMLAEEIENRDRWE